MALEINMLERAGMTRKIITFALPIMASGIVQQSFNAIDVAVVGRFVGSHAVAAVGTNGPVISLIINLFIGIAIGSNVIIANYLGQKDSRGVSRAVQTSAMLALLSGIGLLAIGLTVAGPILALLSTPEDILPDATNYLRIFTLGFPAMMVYNFVSAILRSVGDTRRPFYWLCIGGAVNVALNLIFVLFMGMGVEGVAIATVASNYLSAIGVTIILMHEQGPLRLDLKEMKIHRGELRKILQIGLPAGLQGMVFALSNSFIQSGVNSFGKEAIAGSAAAINFELYCYFVISSFTQAATAFISQNFGAGKKENVRSVFRRCMTLSVIGCAVLNVLFCLFRHEALSLFINSEEAISFGAVRMEYVLLMQFIACSYEIAGASMRALGYSMTPTVIVILGTCILRVFWVSAGPYAEFKDLLIVYPLSWVITGTAVLTAYFIVARKVLKN
ncbi:MAG: MATE family efflux transporter [Bacteroides sp.]|nr:MATE family efflux transporter [Bacteroides sp.]